MVFVKALNAPTGSICLDQPVSTFFFSIPVQLLPSSVTVLGVHLATVQLVLQASVKTAKLWEKSEKAPPWASICYTLWLQSNTWAHDLAPGPGLSYTAGTPCPIMCLASPGLTLSMWFPGLTLGPRGLVPWPRRSPHCLAASLPSFVGQTPCCSLRSFVLRAEKVKEI